MNLANSIVECKMPRLKSLRKEGLFLELFEFIQFNWNELLEMTLEHIKLVGLAVSTAILTGVPFGIYISQRETLANLVLAVAGIIMTIPSIALFGIMIPILSIINQGIGFLPAFIALILYSQLPIIRNTYIAIKNVDPNVRDAAIGMGMTTWERLYKVEIPIALPLIMAGVRTAVVLTIGIAAIAAYIGAGGLGVYIARGISTSYQVMVQVGALAVSILAISIDLILGRIQKKLSPKGARS
jgi:osmoprotectant transport system permease protein